MDVSERIAIMNQWTNESRIILNNLEDDIDMNSLAAFPVNTLQIQIRDVVKTLRSVLIDLIESQQWFTYGLTSSSNYTYWLYLHLDLVNVAGDITWQQIVEAWVKDDFAGRAMTIATIDRMRQIIWDEPFKVWWAAKPELVDI